MLCNVYGRPHFLGGGGIGTIVGSTVFDRQYIYALMLAGGGCLIA